MFRKTALAGLSVWVVALLVLVGCGGGGNSDPQDAVESRAELDSPTESCLCGDENCQPACSETVENCPYDCRVCGDGLCSPSEGPIVCAIDCCGGCGDGQCRGFNCGEDPSECPADCGQPCGNQTCDPGENPFSCQADCQHQICGNGVCEPNDDGPSGCPQDCGPTCGNCTCEKGEDWLTCPVDCGYCGDDVCSSCALLNEGPETCLMDCCQPACAGKQCGDDGCSGQCGECAVGQECDAEGICQTSQGGIGSPCEEDADCSSGFCIFTAEERECSAACTDACPFDWQCLPHVDSLPDEVSICVPLAASLCRPCQQNKDCWANGVKTSDACIPHGAAGSYCGADCTTDACPTDYDCLETEDTDGASVMQCMPQDMECECKEWFAEVLASTTCFGENEWGKCLGQRTCKAQGLTACDAAVPAVEQCNGVDDDCDENTDPPDSPGCVMWFMDTDGDDYGDGPGDCLCEPTSSNHVTLDGDCDEANVGVNPGAQETCNFIDDDCDGATDESNATGCEMMYFDGDNDGYGDATKSDCSCKKSADYEWKAGDCDDADPLSNPGEEELCDEKDNDCNGQTDEENAIGCLPLYLDKDSDSYGLSDQLKCLCGESGSYTATKGGDCDDTEYNVHPTVVELCDGLDNNCNGQTDEDPALASCGIVAHAQVACQDGCVISECDPGYFDQNEVYSDGCEFQP